MVLGIGTDIIEISRIADAFARQGERIVKRVLTNSEYERWENITDESQKIAFLAKRWCAKEAIAKALGTGIAQGIGFHCMNIERLPSGAPHAVLNGPALEKLNSLGAKAIHISISDEQRYAVAFCTISN